MLPSEVLQPALIPRRLLGEVEVQADGSFHLSIPANIPLELQLIDQQGMALRTCGWIWSKNVEARGCIGCHEDGESTPHNLFTEGLKRPAGGVDPAARTAAHGRLPTGHHARCGSEVCELSWS